MLTRNGWFFVVLTAACFAAGVALNYRELVMLGAGFLLCLLFAALWLALRPKVEVHRDVIPARVSEGEGAAGVLTIHNVARRRSPPITALEAFADTSITIPLPGITGNGQYTGSYLLPADRRGCYSVGPLRIAHSDPLQLVNLTQSHGAEATLWVHPLIHRMSPVPTGRTQEVEGPTNNSAPSGGIAFHSLREYVPGDDLRFIHWRSTARLDKLMVRHTVVTNEPKIMVLLDTSEAPYDDESFEDAVRIAASLVVACVDHRYPTEFRTTGGLSGAVDPTGQGRMDVLDKLASVQRSKDDPGLTAIVSMAARREQGVSLGVVTGQPEREKANAVGQVRSRFQMVTFVQLGERLERPAMNINGVLGISADTSEDLVRIWKRKVGS